MGIFSLLLLFGIGFVSGLRSITGIAAVCWAAHLGWLPLQNTKLAFIGSSAAAAIFTLGAIFEYIADKLPNTPNRTAPGPLGARIVFGGFTGLCIGFGGGTTWAVTGLICGAVGGVAGAFLGYQARARLVRAIKGPDYPVAIFEDLVAILLALTIVFNASGRSLHT